MKTTRHRSFPIFMVPLLTALALIVAACGSGGSDGETISQAPPPASGSVTLNGTVSGTVIKVLRADTGAVIAQADTTTLPGPSPFPFSLSNLPTGVPIKMFFFSAGQTFPLYVGNPPGTNVFTLQTPGAINLGVVAMASGQATPANPLLPPVISEGVADPSSPPGVSPPPATVTIALPAPATGSVIIDFVVQDFSIGGQGQQHLHIRVDGGAIRHFFNGLSNKVVDDSDQLTGDVQWQSPNSFQLKGLSAGLHQVSIKLATAADNEFANPEANPPSATVTIITPPVSPATLSITSPSPGATLPSGPVDVSFTVQDFTIGGQGAPHVHIYLDGGAAAHFFNSPTNQVLDTNGLAVPNITWQSNSSFQVSSFPSGPHQIRLTLVDAGDQDLPNTEANPPTLNIMIQASPAASTVAVTSGTSFLSSPVRITFSVTNFTIGLPGTSHLRFSIDGGPLHDFYNGAGIDSDNGVQLNGVHDHSVHWTSTNSFDLFGLPAGAHQVSLALVDAGNTPLPNVGASTIHNYNVQQPPTGELQLEPVLSGLSSYPVGLAWAPDGRIFYTELLTGAVRIINPGWQLDPTPFCIVSVLAPGNTQGLLGLALDPNYASNQSLYVFYTSQGQGNRVSRLTNSGSGCTEDIILNFIPNGNIHNGGIIHFGPDGKLYVFTGDADNGSNAQDLDSLAGKILRVNSDGTAPLDNPFYVNGMGNRDRVYSYGHRNGIGFTFHPQTNHLWESENGPDDNDEINRVAAGGNYGWPTWRGIVNQPGFIDPILTFNPVISPTGIIAIPGDSSIYPPAYRNNLLVAAYNDGTIRHVILSGTNLDQFGGTSVAYTGGNGGLLSFMLGTDGYVYVSNVNGIFRVILH